ncbi:extradiol ring-cleavage dioxygenase [Saccharothrix sp. NRRL B-16348]|uniref:dioxygenase family protein n=1 Tax=Saccharothrix sp. NRRL B-16348 TaxID=1415542 RepID=UPI0006AE6856|nr:class III extradiol ring-cleavage dioxygenase [Saccharothrix sp. NRRL B-16348]KOX34115.1 extradiol ring-cleavage dioxygenase [Saccharothrix sp. NRRL B-16348]
MPVLYLGHGAPPLADDERWTGELRSWSATLPRPESILIVSAHWENAPLTLGATTTVPLTYDFWGFPQRYYEVTYDAPGAPELAREVTELVDRPVAHDERRGLDHGAYVPLKEMFPEADVPVLQLSMPSLDPRDLFDVGRALAPLRDQGVLIVGSGFMTHNLSCVDMSAGPDYQPPSWSAEFDDWAGRALADGDVDALLDFQRKAPAAGIAHPRTEHFAPLFVSLGASAAQEATTTVDGFWYGLSKRSVQFA